MHPLKMLFNAFVTCLPILLFVTSALIAQPDSCLSPSFSISQSVQNEGFHREINWLIESLEPNNDTEVYSACRICLQLQVPPGLYVNPDEISELVRTGQLSAYVDRIVNVEAPAHESEAHNVYIFISSNDLVKRSLQLPIHMRYQRAVISGGFGRVNLPRPSLLMSCPRKVHPFCKKYEKLTAACSISQKGICEWQNVTYQALFDEIQLFVPIGNVDDYPLVSIVTLLLGCAGSIYILSLLSSAPL